MDALDLIIKLGSGITAVGIIFGVIVGALKIVFKPILKKLTHLETHSEENYMNVLRLTIMSEEMPIGERINAGYKYLQNGGNGDVKKFLKEKFNITDSVNDAPHYKK